MSYWEQHVAQICVRQERDFPHGPLEIDRPHSEQGWWDIVLNVLVRDDKVVEVTVEEITKSP